MITERDIREKTFGKATFGGYDMSEVDEFLEELAASAAGTQKEFATLRGKMKVLVDKIEEYRSTEDAMRQALISAQKVAQEVENEARAKAEAVLAEAQEKAGAILAEANARAEEIAGDLITRREMEEKRLAAAREASADYIDRMLDACRKQSDYLTSLAAVGAETEEPVPAAEEIAEPVAAAEEPAEETAEAPIPDAGEEVDEPTRMFRF